VKLKILQAHKGNVKIKTEYYVLLNDTFYVDTFEVRYSG
jgi:hypothetical protein